MPKYSSHTAALVVAAALLSACTHGTTAQRANDSLVIGRLGDFQSLNPLLISGSDTATIAPLVFSFLLTADANGRLTPDLARVVPSMANGGISRDGTTIVYHLRKSVLWQDGRPLTSADVAFTYRQVMNPRNNVEARDVYDQVARVDAPDPSTVRVKLRQPNSAVLSYFFGPDGNYTILPQHLLSGYSDLNHVAFNSMPVGSGPFRVVDWVHGDRLRLERFDGYFGGRPALREIVLKVLASQENQLIQMRTHEIGATFDASVTQLPDFAKIPGVRAVRAAVYGGALLGFNMRDPMMSDVRVRRALVEAADLPRIVAQASNGALTSTDAGRGFFGPDYNPSIAGALPYDPAAADRLLDQAGWRRNGQGVRQRNGVRLAPAFVYLQSSPEVESFAVLLQATLRRAGAALTLRPYPSQVYGAPASAGGPLYGGKFQMTLLQLIVALDPSTEYFLGCDRMPPKGANLTRYCSDAVDRANAASIQTYDPKERAKYSAAVQRQVAHDFPFVPVWQQANAAAYPANLTAVYPSAFFIFGNVARWRF